MVNHPTELQSQVLNILSGKLQAFYLAGGTALARYYFQHRTSEDLDFFTQEYDRKKIDKIIQCVTDTLHLPIHLVAENSGINRNVRMVIFMMESKPTSLKMDFVEDYVKLMQPCLVVDGISILSLPDIYIRKIFTVIGATSLQDDIGRTVSTGRQEAKDYFDLYYLSQTHQRLSEFARAHCSRTQLESLIQWFRTYDRMNIKTGLLDLKQTTRALSDPRAMEAHFKKEIDQLLAWEIGEI